jgi:hypothetical protein
VAAEAAVGELEVRFPDLAISRHLAFCLDAPATFVDGVLHPLAEAGRVARPRLHVARDRAAIFADTLQTSKYSIAPE